MLKKSNLVVKIFFVIASCIVIITVILISISGNRISKRSKVHYINDSASADNKVEALKTMTADLISVESKNKQLQVLFHRNQLQNQRKIADLKRIFSAQINRAIGKIHQQDAGLYKKMRLQPHQYPVVADQHVKNPFVWVSNLSHVSPKKHGAVGSVKQAIISKNRRIEPAYTIPVNATLTGATLITPLIGRIPINGRLPSPYHFKLVLSANNLTANGYPLSGIKGAVMGGIVSGDMLGSCVRGNVRSITFIFTDGTISTVQAKGDNASLGYISSQAGNPCIPGTFHSDAPIFMGAQIGFSAAKGYTNAFAGAHAEQQFTAVKDSFGLLLSHANQIAAGRAGSAVANAAQI